MNELKQAGKAVIVVSSELTECMGISDRIYIMHEGEMTGVLEPSDMQGLTEDTVIKYATGANKQQKEI